MNALSSSLLLGLLSVGMAMHPHSHAENQDSQPFQLSQTFEEDFDASLYPTKLPNKNTEVRDGVLWTRGDSGGKYPPMVYLTIDGKDLDISFRYRHLESGGMVWFFVDGDDGFGSQDHQFRMQLLRTGIRLQIDAHSLDASHPDRGTSTRPADKVSGAYRISYKFPQEKLDLSSNEWHEVQLSFRGEKLSLSLDGDLWKKDLAHKAFNQIKRKLLWMKRGGTKGIELDDIKITEHPSKD